MKLEYLTPEMSVEDLEKEDILLSSIGEEEQPAASELSKSELENAYRDISGFSMEWLL